MKAGMAIVAISLILLFSSLLIAETEQDTQWKVKPIRDSLEFDDEYTLGNCRVLTPNAHSQIRQYGVRIIVTDPTPREGRIVKLDRAMPDAKNIGLEEITDVWADESNLLIKTWLRAKVELLSDWANNGEILWRSGTILEVDIFKRKVLNDKLQAIDWLETDDKYRADLKIDEKKIDLFTTECRKAVKDLPQEVRTMFYGYAGIK